MGVVFAVQQLLHVGSHARRNRKRQSSILFGQLLKEQLCFLLSKRSHSRASIHKLICGRNEHEERKTAPLPIALLLFFILKGRAPSGL